MTGFSGLVGQTLVAKKSLDNYRDRGPPLKMGLELIRQSEIETLSAALRGDAFRTTRGNMLENSMGIFNNIEYTVCLVL